MEFRELHYFLAESENIEQEKKEEFLNSLSQKDYKRINAMMTQLLYTADEDGKATLMGKIYRSRLLGEIDDEMMLRICSVVNKAFLPDLDHLYEYTTENGSDDYIRDNLNALGLLQDLGTLCRSAFSINITRTLHEEANGMDSFGPTSHKLNVVGRELLRIKES